MESENLVAHRAQVGIAPRVLRDNFRRPVNIAVNFNVQLGVGATEVCNVVPDLMLPTEFQSLESPVTQKLPRDVLRWCLLLSQLPRPIPQPGELQPAAIVPLYLWERGWGEVAGLVTSGRILSNDRMAALTPKT